MGRPSLPALGELYGLSARQLDQLDAVLSGLAEDEHAPTTVRATRLAIDVHLADSLTALELSAVRASGAIADLGAGGAGFPGLVLAIAVPEAKVSLVESQARKCAFIERLRTVAGIENARVVCTRVEEWGEGLGRNRVVVARALAAQPVVLEYAAPLLEIGGTLVDWRGRRGVDEETNAIGAAEQLGLRRLEVRHTEPYEGAQNHHLHVFEKVKTPPRFPRRVGVARKRPLGARVSRVGTVYAIANQKGGVGKTTTAVNVAACIAEAGRGTLLVDVDPQANATVGLGLSRSQVPGLYEVLTGDVAATEALVDTAIPGLRVLPAGPGLAGANVELPRIEGFEQRLGECLEPVRGMFEFILLDCPPSLGPLTVSALVAADRVIVPVQTEYFALEGLAGLLETLALVQRELNPRLTVAGMLLTMHDSRTRLGRDVEREVREHFPELVFDTVIPRNVRVGEAPSYGLPVTHHDPHSAGAAAYFELAKEVAARG